MGLIISFVYSRANFIKKLINILCCFNFIPLRKYRPNLEHYSLDPYGIQKLRIERKIKTNQSILLSIKKVKTKKMFSFYLIHKLLC